MVLIAKSQPRAGKFSISISRSTVKLIKFRSNCLEELSIFCKKGVLKNFKKFTQKHLCQSLFFNKVETLLKKRLCHRSFPLNVVKFLRIYISNFYKTPLVAATKWSATVRSFYVGIHWICLLTENVCLFLTSLR